MKALLQAHAIGFGTAPLATAPAWGSGDPIPQAQALRALETAYARGIRLFDTAPNYVKGLAETRTGVFLGQVPRDSVTIATKVGFDIRGEHVVRDYSRDGVLRSLEGSLQRLQVPYVDIVHVHDPDDYFDVVIHDTLPALIDLRRQKVIKAISVGINQWQLLQKFADYADFDGFMLAGRYTLLEQEALPFLEMCAQKDIPIMAASIYNSGILASGSHTQPRYNHAPAPNDILERVQRIEAICQQWGVDLHVVATQFPLAHRAIHTIVVGFQHEKEVTACLRALQHPISSEFWQALKTQKIILSTAPTPKVKSL